MCTSVAVSSMNDFEEAFATTAYHPLLIAVFSDSFLTQLSFHGIFHVFTRESQKLLLNNLG